MKTNKTRIRLLFLVFLLFTGYYSSGQLVNIEKQRKDIKPGWQGTVNFGFSIDQNTKSIFQFSNTVNLQYTHKQNTFLILNDITLLRVKSQGDNYDLINKNFQHIRYNYHFKNKQYIVYELFTQRQQNKIRYIKDRFLLGSGLRFRCVSNENLHFYLAPLVMYEYESLDDSLNSFSRMLKGDLYFSVVLRLNEILSLSHVTYYQPALVDLGSNIPFEPFKDFRLSSETDLTFTIIKNFLEFSVNFQLSYDSRPPTELRDYPLFYSLKNKLTFKF